MPDDDPVVQMRITLLHHTGPDWQGGSRYIRNLAHALASLPPDERRGLTVNVEDAGLIPDLEQELAGRVDGFYRPAWVGRLAGKVNGRLGFRLQSMARSRRRPTFVYPFVGGVAPRRSRYSWASWIPDFQHLHLPEMFSDEERRTRDAALEQIAARAPGVVFSSAMARRDFEDIYAASSARTYTLSFASVIDPSVFERDPAVVQRAYGLPPTYFLVSNQFWAHKGYDTLVEAAAGLRDRGEDVTIVCTGLSHDARHPSFFADLAAKMERLGVSDSFRILGGIPRSDQLQLMRGSIAVIQPSLFEGWSTVVEDARAIGARILLSDFPVHVEQDPPFARFFPRSDPDALAGLIQASLTVSPGPDPQREAEARIGMSKRVLSSGRAFLKIASDVRVN